MEAAVYTLRFTDCRYNKYLSVSGLFDILEDITMQSAEKQGFGYTAMDAFSLSWIVSDWNSRLYFRPAMGETVSVFAHVRKIGAGVLKWQYRMEAADGRTVSVASATWGAANLKEGKAVRIPEAIKEKITAEDTEYLAYAHPGGSVPTDAEEKSPFVFFTGEKDFNGHINNVSSIIRAMDVWGKDDASVTAFSAAYATEASAGKEAVPYVAHGGYGDTVYITGENGVISRFYIECEVV